LTFFAQRSVIRGFTVPPQMVDDLLTIANLPRKTIDQLITAMDGAVGFLNEEGLKQLVQEIVPDEREASAVVSTIRNIRPGRIDQILASLADWRHADAQNAQRMPDEAFAAIQESLRRLIQDYPAWERFRKARRLATVTGNKARKMELIRDARPVFDEERQHIEGFIPLITLKLTYDTQTEETGTAEVLLTVDMLEELLEKANKARQKVSVLRESLNQWIPEGVVEPKD
jgi:hypothetical protein